MADLVFALRGSAVDLDYADRLWREVAAVLPWLADEPDAGILPLAGVSPGDRELYLTRRARLGLRLPRWRQADARALTGARLRVGGELAVGEAIERPLAPARVLYSAFVSVGEAEEQAFLAACRGLLAAAGFTAQMVCGKARRAAAAGGEIRGYSLMLHGLGEADSLRLQHRGLGGDRKRGCGIFVPHKSIAAVAD
jgi:CRISPR-associated protein Cas6